jgi:predicted CXXCH cytochrome family protein
MPPRRFRAILILIPLLFSLPLLAANPCRDCHAEAFTALDAGPHRAALERDARFCTSCHGDAAKHLASPEAANIIGASALAGWTSEQQAAACASCHAREFPGWRQSAHAAEGLCWSCHTADALHFKRGESTGDPIAGGPSPSEPALSKAEGRLRMTEESCVSCHGEVGAQTRMHYRHPLENGQVTCTSCHDIHGRTPNAQQLVADATCLTCHEEQSGPFLFAHGAMENGCSTCHAPHGSAHRGQLRTAGNGACLSCHVQTNFPTVGAASHDFRLSGGGRCWDCHSEVHGSNTTPDFNPRGRR